MGQPGKRIYKKKSVENRDRGILIRMYSVNDDDVSEISP